MVNCVDFTVAVVTQNNRSFFLDNLIASIAFANNKYHGEISLMLIGIGIEAIVKRFKHKFIDLDIDSKHSSGRVSDGRQIAIQKSNTEWILFIDDDCVVDQEIFIEYSKLILNNQNKKIGAIYGLTNFFGNANIYFKACWRTPFVHPFQIANLYDDVEWATTSNALFSKNAVNTIGGFDLSIPVKVSGEDVDIGIRLGKGSFFCLTCPNAKVYHTVVTWNKLNSNIKRFFAYGRSEAWLAQKYPDRRKISLNSLILALSIILGCVCIYWFVPFVLLVWLLSKTIKWFTYSLKIPLISYIIADIYLVSNYFGYLFQIPTLGIKYWVLILFRFEFYRQQYIQSKIMDEGPY